MPRMSLPVQNRILAYAGSLALHAGNGIVMGYSLYFGKAMQNPDSELTLFRIMAFRFITIWNVIFQIVYASLSLCCEIYDLLEEKRWRQHRQMAQKFRDTLFCGVLWPVSVMIFTIFWPFYIYDRNLIFPTFIDKVLSQLSNHTMHTSILFIVLWELAYNPRKAENYGQHLKALNAVYYLYLITLLCTHWQFGAYPYPILKMFSNTQLASFLFAIYILVHICYILQWKLTPILTKYVEDRRLMKEL